MDDQHLRMKRAHPGAGGEDDDTSIKKSRLQAGKIFAAGNTIQSLSASSESEDERPGPMGSNSLLQGFVKKPSTEDGPMYSDAAKKMMERMGFKKGEGLGKKGQGRKSIVEASMQKGRRGLGLSIKGFDPENVDWDFDKDEAPIEEDVEWIPECQEAVPSLEEMVEWIQTGPIKMKLDDETDFCSEDILEEVLKCKSVFDHLEGEEMRKARTKSNPYETIRGVFFLNRAAMKMANMDAVLDFMFTDPKNENEESLLGPNDLLYFADVCAGPGGFTEYVLWRKKNDAKGFGFTLKGPCDFKLVDFFAASSEFFEPHYGVGGLDGDGDIYQPENLKEFRKFVKNSTEDQGLHFVMADGGFSVEGQENLQEILSKRLYLCQFLCALSVLRPDGNFVCKLFDLFTPFSVGLVYLMYRAFRHVSIIKPVTSRPANSERYIVCKHLREDAGQIHDYMFEINLKFRKLGYGLTTQKADITHVVPMDVIKSDQAFLDYIIESNEKLGEKQCIALLKIQTFAKNQQLRDVRQSDTREKCLQFWQIPDELRTAPDKSAPKDKFSMLEVTPEEFVSKNECLDSKEKLNLVRSIYDYRCYVSGGESRCLLFGTGGAWVYKYDDRRAVWKKFDDVKIELPSDTVIIGEIVQELRGEGKGQRRINSLHVIDAVFLGKQDVRHLHITARLEKLKKFLKAINRPTRSDVAPIRVKNLFKLEEVGEVFERLSMKIGKSGGARPMLSFQGSLDQDWYFKPLGMCLVKTTKDPWMMALSRSAGKKYFFNTMTHESSFEYREAAIGSVKDCLENTHFWEWREGVKLLDNANMHADERKISKDDMMNYVNKQLHP